VDLAAELGLGQVPGERRDLRRETVVNTRRDDANRSTFLKHQEASPRRELLVHESDQIGFRDVALHKPIKLVLPKRKFHWSKTRVSRYKLRRSVAP